MLVITVFVMAGTRNFLGKWAITVLFEMRWRTLTENGSRRSRNPPRRAHGTLQPLAESVIVGYYTSAEVHLPSLPVSAAQWARKERYGKRRRYRPYQREKYEIDHTEIEKCPAA